MGDERAARAVKWANLPGHGNTIAEACKKFGVTPSAYRKARKTFGSRVDYPGDELVLAGLSGDKPVTVATLVSYYDWIDHSHPSREEMIAILERLVAQGFARKVGDDSYALTREWP